MGLRSWTLVVLSTAVLVIGAGDLSAQGGANYTPVENPYQAEYEFTVGSDLTPNVSIDDVRWRLLRLDVDDGDAPIAGEEIKAEVTIEVENLGERSARVNLILLLEDDRGGQLERVELKTFKASSGRFESEVQRIKIDGGTAQRLGKVYVFAEIS
jgi:hypothetical protein